MERPLDPMHMKQLCSLFGHLVADAAAQVIVPGSRPLRELFAQSVLP
jgi:hypothetical protein